MSKHKPNARVIHAQHRSSVWFTPRKIRELAARVLGTIALDPCTHKTNPLGALAIFTRADAKRSSHASCWLDALTRVAADGRSLWMNPPFGEAIGKWLALFLACVDAFPHMPAMVLVPARVGARWYRALCDRSQCYVELDGRLRFEVMKGKRLVPAKDCARWGVTLVYFGPDRARVGRLLAPFGAVRYVHPSPARRALPANDCAQLAIPMEVGACDWCGVADPHHRAACPTLEAIEHRDGCTCECKSCGLMVVPCTRARPCCPDCMHDHGVEAQLDAEHRRTSAPLLRVVK